MLPSEGVLGCQFDGSRLVVKSSMKVDCKFDGNSEVSDRKTTAKSLLDLFRYSLSNSEQETAASFRFRFQLAVASPSADYYLLKVAEVVTTSVDIWSDLAPQIST